MKQAFRDRHKRTVFRQSEWLRQRSITDISDITESEHDDLDTEDDVSFPTRANNDNVDSRMTVGRDNGHHELTLVDLDDDDDDEIDNHDLRDISISGDATSAEGGSSSTLPEESSSRKHSRDSSNRRQSRPRQQSAIDSQSSSRKRKQSRWSIRTLKVRNLMIVILLNAADPVNSIH